MAQSNIHGAFICTTVTGYRLMVSMINSTS